MGETSRDSDDLAVKANLRAVVYVAQNGGETLKVEYGPYHGWVHLTYDVGFACGWAAANGVPIQNITVEYFVNGEKLAPEPNTLLPFADQ